MFAALLMYAATTASVMTLRRNRPDLPRPYRVWPYPALPIAYIATLMVLCVNTLLTRPLESLSGLLIVAAGVPVFFFWRRRAKAASGPSVSPS
jgi:APA family basic amino acid/polyamine antiporter